MEALLRLADELERRDERAAAEQAELERLGREVERLRAEAEAAAGFLGGLPDAAAARADAERAAAASQASARVAVEEAEARVRRAEARGREDERLSAARDARRARDTLEEAERLLVAASAERSRLEAEGEERRRRATALEREARRLSGRVDALPRIAREAAVAPEPGLDGLLAWASRVRGGLLVATAAVSTERERVAREAAELLGAASGREPSLVGVAGVRERVARALAEAHG